MALEPVAWVGSASLSLDIDGTGRVVAVEVNNPEPFAVVVTAVNPGGFEVASATVAAGAGVARWPVPGNRRAVWDDGTPTQGTGWGLTFGQA